TERLVHAGRGPASEDERMRAPLMAGSFPFPLKFGYATVGTVEAGTLNLYGRTVFSLHPHQSLFTAPAEALLPPPPHVSPPAAPCSRPTWRPRSTRCGTARRWPPIVSPSWEAGSWASSSLSCARGCPPPRSP